MRFSTTASKWRAWLRHYAAELGLALAVGATYARCLPFKFLYDDEFLIQKNRFLDSFSYLPQIFGGSSTAGAGFHDSFYRPLQGLLYLFVQQAFGRETWAFHALNIGLHAINAMLVFRLGRALRVPRTPAFFAALLWAVHPIHTEAVTYMSATADPLHTLFLLSALLVIAPEFKPARLAVGLLCFVGALCSKESSVVLPVLVVTMLFFFAERRWHWRSYLPVVPFGAAALVYLLLRKWLLGGGASFEMYKEANVYTESALTRVYTFLATQPRYLELLVFPHDLHMDRAFPVFTSWTFMPVWSGLFMVVVLLACILRTAWSKTPTAVYAGWGALWFLGSQIPQSGILVPTNSFFLEHWMYLPSIGLCISASALVHEAWLRGQVWVTKASLRVPALSVGIIAVLALAIATDQQNQTWADPVTFYSRILEYNPKADRIRHNLAMAYSAAGQNERALAQYKLVLEHTNQYPQTYHNIANLYFEEGKLDLAEDYARQALARAPDFYMSYYILTRVAEARGQVEQAHAYQQKFFELQAR